MLDVAQSDEGKPPPPDKSEAPKPTEDKPVPFTGKKDQICYYHGERKNQLVMYDSVAREEPGKAKLHRVRTTGGRGKMILAEEHNLSDKPLP